MLRPEAVLERSQYPWSELSPGTGFVWDVLKRLPDLASKKNQAEELMR